MKPQRCECTAVLHAHCAWIGMYFERLSLRLMVQIGFLSLSNICLAQEPLMVAV